MPWLVGATNHAEVDPGTLAVDLQFPHALARASAMRHVFGAKVEERHVVLTEKAIYISKVLTTSPHSMNHLEACRGYLSLRNALENCLTPCLTAKAEAASVSRWRKTALTKQARRKLVCGI